MYGIQVNAVIDAVGRRHGEIYAGGPKGRCHVDAETAGANAVKESLGLMRPDADGHVVRECSIVGGQAESGSGVVADGDVVGMAVESILAKGQDNLGAKAADFKDQAGNNLVLVGLDEGVGVMVVVPTGHAGIAVLEHIVGLDTQLLDRLGQFRAPELRR